MLEALETAPRRAVGTRGARGASLAYGVLAVVLLALLLRVAVVLATPRFATIDDSFAYDRAAVSIVQHGTMPSSLIPPTGGPEAWPAPLFPSALAVAYKLTGVGSSHARWEAGRMLEALLGAVSVWLIYLIAVRLFDRRVALLAGAIAAVFPPLILVGTSLMSESLFIPLVLAAVLAALSARSSPHRLRWELAAGALVGLVALTRGNGVILVVPIAALVWNLRPRWSVRSVRGPLAVVCATALTLTPWAIRNSVEFHQFVPISTETGYALAGTYNDRANHNHDHPALWTPPNPEIDRLLAKNPRLNEAQIGSRLQREAIDYIGSHPAYPLKVVLWTTLRNFNLTGPGFERWSALWEAYPPRLAYWSVISFWLLVPLVIVGVLTGSARGTPWSLWAVPVVLLLSTLVFAGLTRYRAPADPFLVMLAAGGVAQLWRRRHAMRHP